MAGGTENRKIIPLEQGLLVGEIREILSVPELEALDITSITKP